MHRTSRRVPAPRPATQPITDPSQDPEKPTPPGGGDGGGGERAEGGQGEQPLFYRELWFIVVMAAVALVMLAIVLAIILHKALNKAPFTRERPPLVPLPSQKRSPMVAYPRNPPRSYLFDTVPDTTSFSNTVTLKGFTMHLEEVLDIKCEAMVGGGVDLMADGELGELGILSVSTLQTQSSLHRSVSQVMDAKPLPPAASGAGDDSDSVWDPHVQGGHDSGMFMDDEVFVDTVKGFSTVRKEHTMFPDTNL